MTALPGPGDLLRRARLLASRVPRAVWLFAGGAVALGALALGLLVAYYSGVVSRTMDGRRWNLPTRVYSDVWVVRPGDALGPDDVVRRLQRLRYSRVEDGPVGPGRFLQSRARLVVYLNDHDTAYGRRPGFRAQIDFSGRRVASLRRADDAVPVPFLAFEPEVVGTVFDQKMEDRTLVSLDQVPKVLVDAIVATEDRDFFSHSGISLKRIAGASVRNLFRGSVRQGGSTLTQQLVKNLFLTPERTFRRKAIEALLAMIVEAKYGKREILEAYLNEIYLGQRGSVSVTGVAEAARFYFGKPVTQLDLPEAALLAGLIASPGRFSPFRFPERARERRDFVLKGMLEEKKIGQREYAAALAAPLTAVKGPTTGIEAPYFVDFVLGQVKESRAALGQDGMSIYTTLDPEMQAAAQAAVQRGLDDLEKRFRRLRPKAGQQPLEAALIALDPGTGSVRALVGGRDYQTSQFDRAVQARRQPGSLFKPFVYLAAFSRRDLVPPITPATILQDSPIALVFGTKDESTWSPKNYDNQFRGPMTVRQALEQSINIPAVRTAVTEVAPGKTLLPDVVKVARACGITSELKPYPSLALGSYEVTPMEIATAYATLANGGVRIRPTALIGIAGPGGRRVEQEDAPLARAVDPDALAVLDSLLRGVVDHGTGAGIRRLGVQGILAGKTGTTNDGRDAWFIGFSPRILVVVWVGYDDNRGLDLSGSMAALPIFASFAQKLPAQLFEEPFPTPRGVVTVSIDPTTGMRVTEDCPSSIDELFVAGTAPTQRCTAHGSWGLPPPSAGPGGAPF